ncbi:hypothetical protein K437DRAFT_21375 [Tilletiaria anomala UBC 951]|uniref:Uncharacterized protein n=1 Tax=Tilletiaria anomala (strain ATCC 24038 / CBS 436.72 / UBC 951) TaxID=1037660 RepID=A0A066VJ53_TILAU|nr:uncharacterized protein K437DRAFT_21375 [Tilletiaria anomala UBC 951]KDN38630.1 hypothetical protein K437DRAFT_21375 [Tilletiaria anomala UBC 951]
MNDTDGKAEQVCSSDHAAAATDGHTLDALIGAERAQDGQHLEEQNQMRAPLKRPFVFDTSGSSAPTSIALSSSHSFSHSSSSASTSIPSLPSVTSILDISTWIQQRDKSPQPSLSTIPHRSTPHASPDPSLRPSQSAEAPAGTDAMKLSSSLAYVNRPLQCMEDGSAVDASTGREKVLRPSTGGNTESCLHEDKAPVRGKKAGTAVADGCKAPATPNSQLKRSRKRKLAQKITVFDGESLEAPAGIESNADELLPAKVVASAKSPTSSRTAKRAKNTARTAAAPKNARRSQSANQPSARSSGLVRAAPGPLAPVLLHTQPHRAQPFGAPTEGERYIPAYRKSVSPAGDQARSRTSAAPTAGASAFSSAAGAALASSASNLSAPSTTGFGRHVRESTVPQSDFAYGQAASPANPLIQARQVMGQTQAYEVQQQQQSQQHGKFAQPQAGRMVTYAALERQTEGPTLQTDPDNTMQSTHNVSSSTSSLAQPAFAGHVTTCAEVPGRPRSLYAVDGAPDHPTNRNIGICSSSPARSITTDIWDPLFVQRQHLRGTVDDGTRGIQGPGNSGDPSPRSLPRNSMGSVPMASSSVPSVIARTGGGSDTQTPVQISAYQMNEIRHLLSNYYACTDAVRRHEEEWQEAIRRFDVQAARLGDPNYAQVTTDVERAAWREFFREAYINEVITLRELAIVVRKLHRDCRQIMVRLPPGIDVQVLQPVHEYLTAALDLEARASVHEWRLRNTA